MKWSESKILAYPMENKLDFLCPICIAARSHHEAERFTRTYGVPKHEWHYLHNDESIHGVWEPIVIDLGGSRVDWGLLKSRRPTIIQGHEIEEAFAEDEQI